MKIRLTTLSAFAACTLYMLPAAAADGPDLEIYGTLLPFLEFTGTSGATDPGFAGGADQVGAGAYSGINDKGRFRMTVGTSNIGFRGGLDVADDFNLIWQVENAVPVDGNGPPNTFASRNSHVGFTGSWGTLIYGIWDTPYKWATAVTIGPLRAGYSTDYTAIIGSPGFGVGAINTPAPTGVAAFFRREANSVQYWSPTVGGLSARLSYTINEGRNPGAPDGSVPPTNPYIFSGYVGYDGSGLRLRYAFELHRDFFGMSALGGSPAGPDVRHSTDMGHGLTASYVIDSAPDYKTRLVATGEFLRYKNSDNSSDSAIDEYTRPAFYALVEQSFGPHHVWAAYGQGFKGDCNYAGGAPCSTAELGASYGTLGYLYAINAATNIHLIGYGIFNKKSSQYATFPAIRSPIAAGADQLGIGLGVIHVFKVGIMGDK